MACWKITSHSGGHNAHLPQLETDLQPLLRDDRCHNQELTSLPDTLGPVPLVLRNLATKIRGGRLAGASGPYFLLARIADRERTCGSFRLVAPADVIRAARVSSVTIHGFTPSARSVDNPPELNLDRHSAIRVTTGLEAGILAPNLDAEGALVLVLDGNRVVHVEFTLRLDQARQEVSTRRLSLAALGLLKRKNWLALVELKTPMKGGLYQKPDNSKPVLCRRTHLQILAPYGCILSLLKN